MRNSTKNFLKTAFPPLMARRLTSNTRNLWLSTPAISGQLLLGPSGRSLEIPAPVVRGKPVFRDFLWEIFTLLDRWVIKDHGGRGFFQQQISLVSSSGCWWGPGGPKNDQQSLETRFVGKTPPTILVFGIPVRNPPSPEAMERPGWTSTNKNMKFLMRREISPTVRFEALADSCF